MNGGGVGFWVLLVLLVVLHFVLQVTLGVGELSPDLLTVALLISARVLRPAGAAGLGLLLGLLRDALALTAFGADAVALTVLGYLGSRTRDYFEGGSLLFMAIYLFVGTWLHHGLWLLLARGLEGGIDRLLMAHSVAAAYATLAGLIALSLYRAFAVER